MYLVLAQLEDINYLITLTFNLSRFIWTLANAVIGSMYIYICVCVLFI